MSELWKYLLSKIIFLGYLSSTGMAVFGYYATKELVDPAYLNWAAALFVLTNMSAILLSIIMFYMPIDTEGDN